MKKHFTLIELLIVVTVLMILVSLLQPSFLSMTNKARTVTCQTNLKSQGSALSIYISDHDHFFPIIANYSGLSGNKGNTRYYASNRLGLTDRPLNHYLGMDPKLSQCPSDLGDGLNKQYNKNLTTCYENFGTSYLVQFRGNPFRVKHLFHNTTPVSLNELPSLSNKLVTADWPWHPNRTLSMPESRWHSPDSRSFNTLFADGHTELFEFPLEYEEYSYYRKGYDPNHTWW